MRCLWRRVLAPEARYFGSEGAEGSSRRPQRHQRVVPKDYSLEGGGSAPEEHAGSEGRGEDEYRSDQLDDRDLPGSLHTDTCGPIASTRMWLHPL